MEKHCGDSVGYSKYALSQPGLYGYAAVYWASLKMA